MQTANPSEEFEDTGFGFSGGSAGSIKKGADVFRYNPNPPVFIPGAGPYGPMVTGAGSQFVKAKYDATFTEVGKILSGTDEDSDGTPLTPIARLRLKQALLDGKFLKKSDYVPSAEFGTADYNAMTDLLKEANFRGGYSWKDIQGKIEQESAAGGSSANTYTTYSITNKEDARLVVNKTMNGLLGRDATNDELKGLAQALREYESSTPSVSTRTGTTTSTVSGVSAAGQEQAIGAGLSKELRQEARGVVNTQLGDLFSDLLRKA
jgi:hypothetical protein